MTTDNSVRVLGSVAIFDMNANQVVSADGISIDAIADTFTVKLEDASKVRGVFDMVMDANEEIAALERQIEAIKARQSGRLTFLRSQLGASFKMDDKAFQIRTRGDITYLCETVKPSGRPRKNPVLGQG